MPLVKTLPGPTPRKPKCTTLPPPTPCTLTRTHSRPAVNRYSSEEEQESNSSGTDGGECSNCKVLGTLIHTHTHTWLYILNVTTVCPWAHGHTVMTFNIHVQVYLYMVYSLEWTTTVSLQTTIGLSEAWKWSGQSMYCSSYLQTHTHTTTIHTHTVPRGAGVLTEVWAEGTGVPNQTGSLPRVQRTAHWDWRQPQVRVNSLSFFTHGWVQAVIIPCTICTLYQVGITAVIASTRETTHTHTHTHPVLESLLYERIFCVLWEYWSLQKVITACNLVTKRSLSPAVVSWRCRLRRLKKCMRNEWRTSRRPWRGSTLGREGEGTMMIMVRDIPWTNSSTLWRLADAVHSLTFACGVKVFV